MAKHRVAKRTLCQGERMILYPERVRSVSAGGDHSSIPSIPLIQFHTILLAQSTKFILERFVLVMLFLILNVAIQWIDVRRTHRERSVAILPIKVAQRLIALLRPFGRFSF